MGSSELGGVITFFGHTDMKVVKSRPGEGVKWLCVRSNEDWMGTEVFI